MWTGNPWVDAGVSAMLAWSKKKVPEQLTRTDAERLAEDLLHLYLTDGWKKSLFSVFPNNPVTNPSVRNKRAKLKELLSELLQDFEPLSHSGTCIACGRRDSKTQRTRRDIPLTGYSGSHYFPHKTPGADYCDVCSYAVQCSPLVMYRCGNLALIHSSSVKVLDYWAKKSIEQIRRQILQKRYTGCFDEEFKNPTNALFHIIQDLILQHDEQWTEEQVTIRIYHFTNYNQGADLAIYDLPARVFRFLAMARKHAAFSDWLQVVRKGYRYSIEDKKERDYKNYSNEVYQKLLSNESIVRYFLEYANKRALGGWSLLSLYLKEIKSMDQKRIDAVRRVADDLAELIKSSANPKKELNRIESADSYGWFRNVLLRFMKKHVAAGDEKPLFTFEEYVEQLFPDGALGWKETQDLILFRIYERLHPWLLREGIVAKPEEEEDEQSEKLN
jgi:CRISPR-associated protein Cst1